MMTHNANTARNAATAMFQAQVAMISGVTFNPEALSIAVTDATGGDGTKRTVAFSYAASVGSAMSALTGKPTASFTISSGATTTTAANIDFTLLLDVSPSMLIPATATGIAAMEAQTGCALACHETNYTDSEYTIQYPGWGTKDTYAFAKTAGITLRLDNVRDAASSLVATAQKTMAGNGATYRLAAYTFSDGANPLFALTPPDNNGRVSTMQAEIAAIAPPLMSNNGWLASGQKYTRPDGAHGHASTTLASNTYNNDTGTDFASALDAANAAMATPGKGTRQAGDSPLGVLMVVTDGVDDVSLYNASYCNTPYNWTYSNSYGSFVRCQQPANTALCATIKARGIRIAVLYTTYFPVTKNGWYNNTVAPFVSQVGSNLRNCASSSDLYFEVNVGGDIAAAMKKLFENAIASAPHITR